MKTIGVSLAVWCVQVITLCAFYEDLLTTQALDVSTTTSEQLTTNQDVRTKITTKAVTTTAASATEMLSFQTSLMTPTPELSGFTSSMEDDRRNNTVSTSHHNIMSLTETSVSTNTTSVVTEVQETGTNTENTFSINIQETTEIELDPDLQTATSTSWTENETSDTDEATTSTMPLVYLMYETDVTVTSGNDGTTDQHLTTAGTHMEIRSTNQTAPEDTMNTVTPAGTLGSVNITEPLDNSTQVTSGSTGNPEEHLVSTTDLVDWRTEQNTEPLVTTQGNVYDNTTNTTWSNGTWSENTEDTWSTNTTTSKNISTSETESTTDLMDWVTEENTEAFMTTQENVYDNTTNTTWSNGTWSENIKDTWSTNTTTSKNISTSETGSTTDLMDWVTEENTEAFTTTQENVYDNTTNTTWTDETLSTNIEDTWSTTTSTSETESTTDTMDWITEEITEALTTTQENVHDNTTNTTWSNGTWSENSEDTNTTTSKNISTSETETPHWTHCFTEGSSPKPRRISKLVCFITMWTLGMIASIFLGLTVFLWVRLSIVKSRVRLRGRGRTGKNEKGLVEKEKESLWAEPDSSAEERVEFWYASGATVKEDRRRPRARQVKTRKNRRRQEEEEEEEEDMIQPKVTLKDITEFYYANGRVRHNVDTLCEVDEEQETESGGQGHTE